MENIPADHPDKYDTDDETDVTRLMVNGKEVVLIGTAHISQESVVTVQRVIEREAPDVVCVELDQERFTAMREEQRWEELDLIQVIKNKQLMFLMARLALGAFQKRMGGYTGVKPGAEMAAAIDIARDNDMELVLCDRNVRITLLRAWRTTPFWRRTTVVASLFGGVFAKQEISEEELAHLRQSQNISAVLDELGQVLPSVKSVLVDERDVFMAHQLQIAPGKKIVAVVGAAHVPGIIKNLQDPITDEAIEAISEIPPRTTLSRMLPWLIPLIVLTIFTLGFFYGDREQFQTAAIAWVLVNGGLSALGALVALGHPLTILVAFCAAPLTSLNPTIGAGMVTALAQTFFCAPKVRDMERVGEDIAHWKGWWKNRLARIFLVFFLSSMGSAIGTFVAFRWLIELV
ncbi:MAG: TraB/GumN family protein [Bradymonadaceae bacterium]